MSRIIRIAAIAVSATAVALGGAAVAQGDRDPDAGAGRLFAEKLCARCHATGASGASPLKQAPPFRNFSRKWPLENIEEALAEGIVVGHEAMPEFELSTEQIDDLIAYLRTLK